MKNNLYLIGIKQSGGQIEFPGIKFANPYLVPEHNIPKVKNTILPDVNREKLLGTDATEYKMGIEVNGKEIEIPTIVGGQFLGAENAIKRFQLTKEKFKPMTDPSSYSRFYDIVGRLGIMKHQKGGSTKKSVQLDEVEISGLSPREQHARKMYADSLAAYNSNNELIKIYDDFNKAKLPLFEAYENAISNGQYSSSEAKKTHAAIIKNYVDFEEKIKNLPNFSNIERSVDIFIKEPYWDMTMGNTTSSTPEYIKSMERFKSGELMTSILKGYAKPSGIFNLSKSNKLNPKIENIQNIINTKITPRTVQLIIDNNPIRYRKTYNKDSGRGYEKFVQDKDGNIIESQPINKEEWYKIDKPNYGGKNFKWGGVLKFQKGKKIYYPESDNTNVQRIIPNIVFKKKGLPESTPSYIDVLPEERAGKLKSLNGKTKDEANKDYMDNPFNTERLNKNINKVGEIIIKAGAPLAASMVAASSIPAATSAAINTGRTWLGGASMMDLANAGFISHGIIQTPSVAKDWVDVAKGKGDKGKAVANTVNTALELSMIPATKIETPKLINKFITRNIPTFRKAPLVMQDNKIILTSLEGTRPTSHFTFDIPVQSHKAGNWDKETSTLVIPWKKVRNLGEVKSIEPSDVIIQGRGLPINTRGVKVISGDKSIKNVPRISSEKLEDLYANIQKAKNNFEQPVFEKTKGFDLSRPVNPARALEKEYADEVLKISQKYFPQPTLKQFKALEKSTGLKAGVVEGNAPLFVQNALKAYETGFMNPNFIPPKYPNGEQMMYSPGGIKYTNLHNNQRNLFYHPASSIDMRLKSAQNIPADVNKSLLSNQYALNELKGFPNKFINRIENIHYELGIIGKKLNKSYQTSAKEELKAANKWSEEWYNHPETIKKIKELSKERQVELNKEIEAHNDWSIKGREDPIQQSIRTEEELEAMYPILPKRTKNEWDDILDRIQNKSYLATFESPKAKWFSLKHGLPRTHVDNFGVSGHRVNSDYVKGIRQNLVDKYSPNVTSTAIHEGNHGLTEGRHLLPQSFQEQLTAPFFKDDPNFLFTRNRAYLTSDTEIYARIMQLRKSFGLKPGQVVDDALFSKIMEKGKNGLTPVVPEFFKLIKDPKLFKNLINTIPALTPIGIGATMHNKKK